MPGIISISGIATKINKENAIDDKQLRNTGLSNNYTAYGAGKRQLHTETPWEKATPTTIPNLTADGNIGSDTTSAHRRSSSS
ncbi:hypothetical protein ACLKA6_006041 [Drosophila palustris]